MYLGIDYGEKRIGLAISDRNNQIAKAYDVIINNKDTLKNLQEIIKKEKVDNIVVGLPLGLDEKPTQSSNRVLAFFDNIKDDLNIPIKYINEEMTTINANLMLNFFNIKDIKKKKQRIDKEAARIILQNYLDSL